MTEEKTKFTVNGKSYELDKSEYVDTTLHTFLFENGFRGAKSTCQIGGCGACTVVGTELDPFTGQQRSFPFNSCMASVQGCNGMEIFTVESLGNKEDGYDIIQKRIAEKGATQCGYCTPGFVMAMHGLTKDKSTWTPEEVEKNMDGNLCRCTGYRPILDAMKSITPQDIEDLGNKGGCCKKQNCCKNKKKDNKQKSGPIIINPSEMSERFWFHPKSLKEVYSLMNSLKNESFELVSGNTGHGVYKEATAKYYINLRMVPELHEISRQESPKGLRFGANVSISTMIKELEAASVDYHHTDLIAKHWHQIAGYHIRNLGSWAGNLGLKNRHKSFQSDVFITLVAAKATVDIGSESGIVETVLVEDMMTMDLKKENKILIALTLPALSVEEIYRSFKIPPRAVNSHAHINAAFLFKVGIIENHTVKEQPILAFGAINEHFVRATITEEFLVGKSLSDENVLKEAIQILSDELNPDVVLGEPSPEYRKMLSLSLFYRTVLGIVSNVVSDDIKTGANDLIRPESKSQQDYATDQDQFPLTEPVPKLEALQQASGEAEYVKDMQELPGELHGAFVQSIKANAQIVNIDPSEALEMEGVIDFIGVSDIKGTNNINPLGAPIEQLFPDERVSYHGQPLGLIVAVSDEIAQKAVDLVKVEYADEKRPILTIEEALDNPLPPNQYPVITLGDVTVGFEESTTLVQGTMGRNSQYHFQMETQVARVVPHEDGLDVFSATQWPAFTQKVVSQVLAMPANEVNLSVKRVGGAFGSKISRSSILAAASAIAAKKLKKPVKTNLPLTANMKMMGWREPFYCTYKAGIDSQGKLKAVEATITCDGGILPIDLSVLGAVLSFPSCYQCQNWKLTPQFVLTNTANNTPCRTPGTIDGIAFMETVMDHLAFAFGEDPLQFRKRNLIPDGENVSIAMKSMPLQSRCNMYFGEDEVREMASRRQHKTVLPKNLINQMVEQMENDANVQERKQQIKQFNSENRWTKKGLGLLPMLWPYILPPFGGFNVIVSIYWADSSVAIAHGGIEIGQGINTKVAQCAAFELGCPLDKIKIKPTNTLSGANSLYNAGSIGAYSNAYCIQEACKLLRKRLNQYEGNSWEETIANAIKSGEDLTERYWNRPGELKSYGVFGVACTEVELDVLTGKYIVTRTDLLEDAGTLISPLQDIGQLEGGFVMGQGLFTLEQPVYNQITGERFSDSTWTYNIPTALDIPADFRVKFLKNAPHEGGVYSSKVIAEPSICLAFSVPMALRDAISSARHDAGVDGWFTMDCPITVESIQKYCLLEPNQLVLKSKKKE